MAAIAQGALSWPPTQSGLPIKSGSGRISSWTYAPTNCAARAGVENGADSEGTADPLNREEGQLVTRDEIVERIWGKGVFLDTDNSINAAIRKIRQVLKDDPEQAHFVQTITGRGYRFIAPWWRSVHRSAIRGQGGANS